jgi:hypothetical protein
MANVEFTHSLDSGERSVRSITIDADIAQGSLR